MKTNYKQSLLILKAIKKFDTFVVNCHRTPDVDSVSSCLAIAKALESLNKKVTMISPDEIPSEIMYLNGADKIKIVDMNTFNFNNYDAFIIPDTSELGRIFRNQSLVEPKTFNIVVDHHDGTEEFGSINLIDPSASSTSEIIYLMLRDWKFNIDKGIGELILSGILSDSGGLQYDKTSSRTFCIAAEILDLGVKLPDLIMILFRSYSLDSFALWGELMRNIKLDSKYKFAWTTLDYNSYSKYKDIGDAKSLFANIFIRAIRNTDFGIVIVQKEKNVITVSFRERSGFNVRKIAEKLGGGGHNSSAGVIMSNISLDDATQRILKTARNSVKELSKKND
jgi:phosphoesterase RecJ-like protein